MASASTVDRNVTGFSAFVFFSLQFAIFSIHSFHDRNTVFRTAEVSAPESRLLTMAEVYKTNLPDHELLKQHFIREGRLEEEVANRILRECTDLLRSEPTMLDVASPITGTVLAASRRSSWRLTHCLVACIKICLLCPCSMWRHPRPVLRLDEAV
jgi:hypothetical protein